MASQCELLAVRMRWRLVDAINGRTMQVSVSAVHKCDSKTAKVNAAPGATAAQDAS